MSHDPYTSPAARITAAELTSTALYSPTQAALGALLGGPVGLIYFVRSNFIALRKNSAARNSLIIGAVLILALIIISPLLPAKFPGTPFSVLYIFVARSIVEKFQLSKLAIIESPEYIFKSNWNVLGMGLAMLLVSLVVLVGPYMAFVALGLVK